MEKKKKREDDDGGGGGEEEEIVTEFRVTIVSPNFNLIYCLHSEGVLKDSESAYSETPCITTCFRTYKNPHLLRY